MMTQVGDIKDLFIEYLSNTRVLHIFFTDNSLLFKNFNKLKMFSSLQKTWESNAHILPMVPTNYCKIGIFIDLRCHNSDSTKTVLNKVS